MIVTIAEEERSAIRSRQEREGRWYWSRCAEALFRREGYVAAKTGTQLDSPGLGVYLRGIRPPLDSHATFVLEGPLGEEVLDQFGLSAEQIDVETLQLDMGGAAQHARQIYYPQIHVGGKGTEIAAPTLTGAQTKWKASQIAAQFLSGDSWRPILSGTDPVSGRAGALAVSDGRRLVFGFPVFDILASWMAMPPLDDRFARYLRSAGHTGIARFLIALIADHARGAGLPIFRLHPWPSGFQAGFTLRHDYDRTVETDELASLIDVYEKLDIKVSIGFLSYRLDSAAIDLFREAGHEIALHMHGGSQSDIRDDLRDLRQVAGVQVRGATRHGGPTGVGFRGQAHFEWLDDSGIAYFELPGMHDTICTPVCRIHGDLPGISPMLVLPRHFSLDKSTRPEDHALAELRRDVPAALSRGHYAIVMNHPDIHRDELLKLLSDVERSAVWCATSLEIARWQQTILYGSHLRETCTGFEIGFEDPLPHAAAAEIGDTATVIPKECRSWRLPQEYFPPRPIRSTADWGGRRTD